MSRIQSVFGAWLPGTRSAGQGDVVMRKDLLIVCLVLLHSTASHAEEIRETPQFRTCMDAVDLGAFKTTQWAACYAEELVRQDTVLNDTYRRLANSLSADARASLVTGERTWLTYREYWCRFEGKTSMAPGGEVNRNACLLELTLRQINTLDGLIEP